MPCQFCRPIDQFADVILETDAWLAFLIDKQAYPGRSIVALKRHAASLSDLSEHEWLDLAGVVGRLERAAIDGLGATMANWTCLMNHGFLADPPDPHVHFHFRPRYAQPVRFGGESFTDAEFGHHYADCDSHQTGPSRQASPPAKAEILRRLREAAQEPS